MVVRNCGESPSSLQVLESKVQTFHWVLRKMRPISEKSKENTKLKSGSV